MTWRVIHVDHRGRRRILQLECDARAAAEGLAEAMYGAAFYLAAIRLRGAA